MTFWKGAGRKRRDANEPEIIEALKDSGAVVYQIGGRGLPDLLVNYHGRWTPLEIKTAKGRLQPTQAATKFPLARSVEDALKAAGILGVKPFATVSTVGRSPLREGEWASEKDQLDAEQWPADEPRHWLLVGETTLRQLQAGTVSEALQAAIARVRIN